MLCDENMDVSDETLAFRYDPDVATLKDGVGRMRSDTPYKTMGFDTLVSNVRVSLTPPCECCDEKRDDVVPVGYVDDISDLEDRDG